MSNPVISIESLSKQYRLGVINHGMLYKDLKSWWARLLRQEDPYSIVGLRQQGVNDARVKGDRFWALKNICLEVNQGDRLGIIGRNGAGKSTLLKILSRITAPTHGQVRIKGRVASLLEVGTGFHPELTGRENIYLNGAILGMSKREVVRKLDEIVAFAEVEQFIDTPVKRYSSGMHVRLAFAVAAHLEPEILIVDEVLAVGDAAFQKKCLGKMQDVSSNGSRTVLFVSHNMAAIRTLCEKCVWLEGGRMESAGDSEAVIEKYLRHSIDRVGNAPREIAMDERKPFQLTAVRLRNERGEVGDAFDCDRPIIIEFDIYANQVPKGSYGYLQIAKNDGTAVLVSDSNDIRLNVLDQLRCGVANTVRLTIPRRTLGAGVYSVYVNFTDLHGNSIDSPGTVGRFTLDDVGTSRGNRRGGYLSTLVPWEVLQ